MEGYAAQHGFLNCVHYTDDGWSGGNFDRPSWKQLVADVEAGKVGTVLVKDMSRIGRDYLQTGYFTEDYPWRTQPGDQACECPYPWFTEDNCCFG